ncbi:protein argonaute 16-like [Telopea speciosissima]|uniref:protein argonaute 16-like n=1 Tax=Telopea speciosissima TaxID=54955 RepID=UPI001CC3B101|nr:protein argonaute 16-like [Telopea speciosissima]
MEKAEVQDKGGDSVLPPPPPCIPPNVKPEKMEIAKRSAIIRPGFGSNGRRIQLLTNHFKVNMNAPDGVFFQYSVSITYEDKRPVEGKGIGRKVIDKLYQTYCSELAGKNFVYDGEKSLYTVGPLPQNNFEFTVVLEDSSLRRNGSPGLNGSPSEADRKRSKRSYQSKTFNVEINFATKIPLKSIASAIKGNEVGSTQDALRVLDIILRQQAANSGCLLVRQSFFHDDVRNLTSVGGGVSGCRGFHSSFRTTQSGLSLNMDVSTTMILTPGPVIDFLTANQNVRDNRQIDWAKAKKMLKNIRIKTRHSNMEFKITGLSEKPCNQQFFTLKVKNGDGANGEDQTMEVTVYDYFTQHRKMELTYSAYMPCLDVGKSKRHNYLPLELCSLVSLQRYTKALSSMQRSSLVERSRQKPQERIQVVTDAVKNYRYDEDPVLASCGIFIEKKLTAVDGRVLDAPTLKVGNNEDCVPRNGRWNFNHKRLLNPTRIDRWVVVNFSARCDMSHLSRELINCGRNKGIHIERPYTLIEEDPQWRRAGPVARVEKMFEQIRAKLPGPPQFLLCVLPERKNSDIYGPWKRKNLHEMGIVTQCISPTKINDQYLTNVLLKINSKLGGTNSLLAIEHSPCIPFIKDTPTMILGMDVSHGSPGRSDVPSIAAVVGSRSWPLISRYRAAVRTQSPKVEMIDSLYKPLANGDDDGIMRELLTDFYQSSQSRKPEQIIIFRDGVSESQFNQVLNIELEQVIKAFQHLGETWLPKFTVIVAQKNHHTKIFQAGAPENVPPGTVVDTKVVHPRNYDFYMCAQAGMIGTSRPAHYHVLLDEIGFTADDLQSLVHSLSYVYQRSTTAISVVAPVCYAHLAAQQMGQFIKFEDFSDTSSGHGGVTSAGSISVPELPRLHKGVQSSMFFC